MKTARWFILGGVAGLAWLAFYLLMPFVDRDARGAEPTALESAPTAPATRDAVLGYVAHEADGIDALVVLEGDRLALAYGAVDTPMNLASIRKSLLSLLFGIAVDRGLVDLDATLGELGIDESATPLTATEKTATVEHLLQARSGVYLQSGAEVVETTDGRPARGSVLPGERYFYNNWDFNVLGAIFEAETGLGIGEALDLWLARPLGLEDFSPAHVVYDRAGTDSDFPTYRIHMSARDLARAGALVLAEGRWRGRQVVPRDWILASTRAHSRFERGVNGADGFGYSWWLDSEHDAVLGDGWGGQYLYVDRAHGRVVVARKDTGGSRLGYLRFVALERPGHPADVLEIVAMLDGAQGDGRAARRSVGID